MGLHFKHLVGLLNGLLLCIRTAQGMLVSYSRMEK